MAKNKKYHRQDRDAQKGQNGDNKTNESTTERGFWPSDFNQRTPEEKYRQNEAQFKTKFSNQSASKKYGEIQEAMGKKVSQSVIESLKIEILDLTNELKRNNNNNKLRGLLKSKMVKLNCFLNDNFINGDDDNDIDESLESDEMKRFQVGHHIEIGKDKVLYRILSKDGSMFKLKNFQTGEIVNMQNSSGPDRFNIPSPVLANPLEISYNLIKKTKIDSMKDDIADLIRCTTRNSCTTTQIRSSLGRMYMLFKFASLQIESGGERIDGVFTDYKVNLNLFKVYYKIFYEDTITVDKMFEELRYLMTFWEDFENNGTSREDFINETATMVNRVILVFNELFSNENHSRKFLMELYNELSGFIPPLKRTKFVLDPFQIDVCNQITNKKSFLLVAPTSSGKSVLSTYVLQHWKDGLILIVVPNDSDVLAWQFAAKIESEMSDLGTNTFVPILTENYKSILSLYTEKKNDDADKVKHSQSNIFEKIRTSKAIVGTASQILNLLPEIETKSNRDLSYLIFDEIHTINNEEGKDMEHISKIVGEMNKLRLKEGKKEIPFMGLSATISNPEFLQKWYQSIGWTSVNIVKCSQRFFNLQLHTTNSDGEVLDINPMSMVSFEDLQRNSEGIAPIDSKEIDFTAPDVWNLLEGIINRFNPDENVNWNPYVKFSYILDQNRDRLVDYNIDQNGFPNRTLLQNRMFELKDVKEYGEELIRVLVDYANDNETRDNTVQLLNSFIPHDIESHGNLDLYNLFKNEVKANRTPCIAFMVNPASCLRFAQDFYCQLRRKEEDKDDPDVIAKHKELESNNNPTQQTKKEQKEELKKEQKEEKKKQEAKDKKEDKKTCIKKEKDGNDWKKGVNVQKKKSTKQVRDKSIDYDYWSPLEKNTFFTDKERKDMGDNFKEIVNDFNDLKTYESNDNGIFWLIDLLQYGVGVYVKGLTGHYLRLIQNLALQKKIKIVISDKSLMFGVSMPFRTAIIFKDYYDVTREPIDPMMFQQMSGRAGRRGADTKGHTIVSGFSWDEIKKICVKEVPKIKGKKDNYLWTTDSCSYLSGGKYGSDVLDNNFLNVESNSNLDNFYDMSRRLSGFVPDGVDSTKFHRMMWKFRNSYDSVIIPFIINPLITGFFQKNPEEIPHQIELGQFLCHFIHISNSLKSNSLSQMKSNTMNDKLDPVINGVYQELNKYGISINPEIIDSKVYRTISSNKIQIDSDNIIEISKFKERFLHFAFKVIDIQHFLFYSSELYNSENLNSQQKVRMANIKKVCTLMGKLVTRLWYEYRDDPMTLINEGNKLIASPRVENVISNEKIIDAVQFNVINDELIKRNLKKEKIIGDGNCLFRAISYVINDGDESGHEVLRHEAVNYISDNRDHYYDFIDTDEESFDEYTLRMLKTGEHGGQYEINALQQILNRPIYVFSDLHRRIEGSSDDNNFEQIVGDPILLNYYDEIDTDSFYRPGHYEVLSGEINMDLINDLQQNYSVTSETDITLTESEENSYPSNESEPNDDSNESSLAPADDSDEIVVKKGSKNKNKNKNRKSKQAKSSH
jgi:hypothetical protein